LCLTAVPLSARPLSVVVTVYPEGEKDGVQAYVYVKQTPSAVAVAVESGDWLTADKEGLAGETVGFSPTVVRSVWLTVAFDEQLRV
jgi:hypothetical protein